QQVSIGEGYQKLLGKKLEPPRQMNMAVPAEGQPPPFSISMDGAARLSAVTRYEVVEQSERSVLFRATSGPWAVDKRFDWEPNGYGLAMSVTVKNISADPQSGELGVHSSRRIEP